MKRLNGFYKTRQTGAFCGDLVFDIEAVINITRVRPFCFTYQKKKKNNEAVINQITFD